MSMLEFDVSGDAFAIADGSPGSFERFVTKLLKIRDAMPVEHRDNATVKLGIYHGYYDDPVELNAQITWSRPQTVEEEETKRAEREAAESQRRFAEFTRKRDLYAALKQEFES